MWYLIYYTLKKGADPIYPLGWESAEHLRTVMGTVYMRQLRRTGLRSYEEFGTN